MMASMVVLSPPNLLPRKPSEPRSLTLPSLAFFNIATSYIIECSLLYSPLRTRTLLSRLLFPLLIVNLPPMLCHVSLVIFRYLFIINRRTEKLIAVPHNLSTSLSNNNPSQVSLPDSKPCQSNAESITTPKDRTSLSQ